VQNSGPTGCSTRASSRSQPLVHADFAAPAALAAPDEQRSATPIEVAFGKRERLMDPQSGAPQYDDQTG
jgi:hypothetical protein